MKKYPDLDVNCQVVMASRTHIVRNAKFICAVMQTAIVFGYTTKTHLSKTTYKNIVSNSMIKHLDHDVKEMAAMVLRTLTV